jgi:putative intracellular protease/amidase
MSSKMRPDDITRRFEKDADANAQLDRTARLDNVKQEDYDTVSYPGGHGPMWDLGEDENSIKLVESFLSVGKTFALVCTLPARCAMSRPRTASRWFKVRP